jgi:hypothetical protein
MIVTQWASEFERKPLTIRHEEIVRRVRWDLLLPSVFTLLSRVALTSQHLLECFEESLFLAPNVSS